MTVALPPFLRQAFDEVGQIPGGIPQQGFVARVDDNPGLFDAGGLELEELQPENTNGLARCIGDRLER